MLRILIACRFVTFSSEASKINREGCTVVRPFSVLFSQKNATLDWKGPKVSRRCARQSEGRGPKQGHIKTSRQEASYACRGDFCTAPCASSCLNSIVRTNQMCSRAWPPTNTFAIETTSLLPAYLNDRCTKNQHSKKHQG